MLSLGQLYTDNDTNDDDDDDDDDDTNDDDNDTRRTNHDCIGSLVCMPNEPKRGNISFLFKLCYRFKILFVKFDMTSSAHLGNKYAYSLRMYDILSTTTTITLGANATRN